MFIIHPGADLCQCPGPFHKPKAAGNPAAFLHRETLSRREFLNPCRLRHTSPIPSSLWPAATTGLRRTPAGGISASLKCGRNLRFPHKRPLPYRKKGTEQEIHNAPITRSKTDMSLWRKDYDSAAPDRSLRNELRLVPGLSGQRACLPWMRSWQRKKSLPELFNPKM